MAVLMRAAVEPRMQVSEAYSAVASIPDTVWKRSGRQRKEQMVADDISQNWVTRAVMQRTRRVLQTGDTARMPLDFAQVHRVRDCIARLPVAWTVPATRIFLNLWTTSHRMHDIVRDGCYWGCDSPDSLNHYVDCIPLRMVAGMFDDAAAPYDEPSSFYGLGPASQCPDVEWAIRRGVLACMAYHAVRAHRRDHGVPTAADADTIARRAAVHAYPAVHHFWHTGIGREAAVPGQRPVSRRIAARERRMGPPASGDAT